MPEAVPIGLTASFSNVKTGSVATANFTMPAGTVIITFQAVDVQNPGVVTLYDSGDNALITMNTDGQEIYRVPHGGATYYFKATLGANLLAMTQPNIIQA